MGKDPKVYIHHILEAIQNIEDYTSGLSEDGFYEHRMVQDAVVRNFEVIGEAAKQIPQGFRNENPNIEWKKMSGLRDVLIHNYLGVDLKEVWKIKQNRLNDLKDKLIKLV